MTIIQEETKDITRQETENIILEEQNLSAEEVLLLQEMAEAGLLYGLAKRKTHPKIKHWIFTTKSGVEIINLEYTIKALDKSAAFLKSVVSSGKQIIIVGTSPSAKNAVKEFAITASQPYVVSRWLGGTLTNFRVIEGRIKYYNQLLADRESGALNKYTKKERILLDKKLEKMKIFFEGIAEMNGIPGAVVLCDIQANQTAAREARAMGIPIVAFINTDTDPSIADYPIPANNRLNTGIRWILNYLHDSYKKAPVSVVVQQSQEPLNEKGLL